MEKVALETCPICGARLIDGKPVVTEELLTQIQKLKDQGILAHTMFVAVKIVQSMNDNNPAWLKGLLDEQSRGLKETMDKKLVEELRPILRAIMELKGSPQILGIVQEAAIAKRLSSLKTGEDKIRTEKSTKSGEDIECVVIERGKQMGKIIIESKKTKKWREDFVEQVKKYMEKENTEFGILATTTMPSDALSYTTWRNGVLIVDLEHVEPAYLFMREHLKLTKSLEETYEAKLKQLEVEDEILHELKEAINNGQLDQIISSIDTQVNLIDASISRVENSIQRVIRGIRKNTNKIRDLTAKLMVDHIEKVRTQLMSRI